jgi:hypothetical protein
VNSLSEEDGVVNEGPEFMYNDNDALSLDSFPHVRLN